jgi:hypothetical protein
VSLQAAMKRYVRNEKRSGIAVLPLVRRNRPQQREAGAAAADRALDSLATLPERRLSKIAHFKLAKSNRSITTVMTRLRRRMLADVMIGDI